MDYKEGFWLFGYGSLIWKSPPRYDKRLPGYVQGYVRRFWQASEDHRGTPEAPGRVVTLIDWSFYASLTDHHTSQPDEKVWGAAYHIPAEHATEMIEYLDIREAGGYSAEYTTFHVAGGAADLKYSGAAKTLQCMVYIGLPTNPHFLGPQDPQTLAQHILDSRGPSGDNREYLFMLEESLRRLDPDQDLAEIDLHVGDLVRRCRAIEGEKGEEQAADVTNARAENELVASADGEEGQILQKTASVEEQEEIEML